MTPSFGLRPTVLYFSLAVLSACSTPDGAKARRPPVTLYDATLAERLGADDYGMRSYVFVLLKTGPVIIDDPLRRKELFAGHFRNMERLAEQDALVLAGPLSDDRDTRGLFILNAESLDDAQAIVQPDPAIGAGILRAEFSSYYGTAILMEMNKLHKRVQRKGITE